MKVYYHGAVAFGYFGKALYEVFKYIGVDVSEIGYNQPKGVRYPRILGTSCLRKTTMVE